MLIPIKELIESSTGANGYVGDEIKNFIRNEKINGSKMDFEQRLKNLKERRSDIQAHLDWNKTMSNSYDPYNKNQVQSKIEPTQNPQTLSNHIISKKIPQKDLNNPYNKVNNKLQNHSSKINIKV